MNLMCKQSQPPLGHLLHDLTAITGGRFQNFGDCSFRRSTEHACDLQIYNLESLSGDFASCAVAEMFSEVWHGNKSANLRLTDDYILRLGERIRTAEGVLYDTNHLRGRNYSVGFLDSNLSKALHVGHMRNCILGRGLARLLESSGAIVQRISFVGDVGRHMAEAMYGFREVTRGVLSVPKGLKADHYIGRAYAETVAGLEDELAKRSSTERDCLKIDDAAEEVRALLASGDPKVIKLWERVCDLVQSGQMDTLSRLNLGFDTFYRESDHLVDIEPLVDQGVRSGLWYREADGSVVYKSGRKECPVLLLAREGGVWTEHARLLTLFVHVLSAHREDNQMFLYAGSEWEGQNRVHYDLIKSLGFPDVEERVTQLYYGMLRYEGSTMKSSAGTALEIDDCLDQLSQDAAVRDFQSASEESPTLETAVDLLITGLMMSVNSSKDLNFSIETVLSRKRNAAWKLLSVWRECDALRDPSAKLDPGSPELRYALLGGQDLWGKCLKALETATPGMIMRFAISYANGFNSKDNPLDPASADIACRVIEHSMNLIGIYPRNEHKVTRINSAKA